MLKLLKHDIRDSYLEIVVLNGILIILSIFAFIGIRSESSFLLEIALIALVLTIFAAVFVVLSSIIKSFHRNLFTNYGYLTLTTPVSIDKILISKIIVNMLWILVTIVSAIICMFIVISSTNSFSGIYQIFEALKQIQPVEVLKSVVSFAISSLSLITVLIFVLVLVNTGRMKKFKLLKGILIYIGISLIMSLSNPFQSVNNPEPLISTTADYIFNLAISLAWSIVFYFVSRYLIKNKLELE